MIIDYVSSGFFKAFHANSGTIFQGPALMIHPLRISNHTSSSTRYAFSHSFGGGLAA